MGWVLSGTRTKKLQWFNIGDEIPENSKYIKSTELEVDNPRGGVTYVERALYEVFIDELPKKGKKK